MEVQTSDCLCSESEFKPSAKEFVIKSHAIPKHLQNSKQSKLFCPRIQSRFELDPTDCEGFLKALYWPNNTCIGCADTKSVWYTEYLPANYLYKHPRLSLQKSHQFCLVELVYSHLLLATTLREVSSVYPWLRNLVKFICGQEFIALQSAVDETVSQSIKSLCLIVKRMWIAGREKKLVVIGMSSIFSLIVGMLALTAFVVLAILILRWFFPTEYLLSHS